MFFKELIMIVIKYSYREKRFETGKVRAHKSDDFGSNPKLINEFFLLALASTIL